MPEVADRDDDDPSGGYSPSSAPAIVPVSTRGVTLCDFVRLIGPDGSDDTDETGAYIAAATPQPADRFYGLEWRNVLGRERSTVYKSLHRLVALGLLEDQWEEVGGTTGSPTSDVGRSAGPEAGPGLRARRRAVA